MKNTLILSVLFSSLTFAVFANAGGPDILIGPDYFSGFYVGGTGAFHMAGFNGFSNTDTPNQVAVAETFTDLGMPSVTVSVNQTFFPAGNLISGDADSNSFDGYYGVHGGVGKVFAHRWYTGFEGFGEWGAQKTTVNNFSNFSNDSQVIITTTPGSTTSQAVPVSGSYQSQTSVKLTHDYGVVFKPGFLVAPQTLIYGKVGAIWANLQVTNCVNGESNSSITNSSGVTYQSQAVLSGSSTNKDNKISLLLGLGLEQFIYRNFIALGIEYNYANYGHVATATAINVDETVGGSIPLDDSSFINFSGDSQTANVGTTRASVNARVSSLIGSLNFYFGSHWF